MKLISFHDAGTDIPAFRKTRNNELNPFGTVADVKVVRVAAISDEHIEDPLQTTPSNNTFENYGNPAEIMMTFASSKIKEVIMKEADRIFAEATQAEI